MSDATRTTDETYDPERPGRLLQTERDELIPLLRAAPDDAYAVRTCCPGWTVRHVLAHCGSALMRVVESRFEKGVYSPESNDRDIAERADWSNSRVVDELERGMTEAGPFIAKSKGLLDGVALGEWVHAGDVREAWGKPGVYGGPGLPDALLLLAARCAQQGGGGGAAARGHRRHGRAPAPGYDRRHGPTGPLHRRRPDSDPPLYGTPADGYAV